MYTIILQNVVNKQIYSYNVEDLTPDGLYYRFDIKLDEMLDGEYEYILIYNPASYPVVTNINNVFKSETGGPVILVDSEMRILSAGSKILVVGSIGEQEIEPISFGLIRIGDYKSERIEYNKQTSYITYERN